MDKYKIKYDCDLDLVSRNSLKLINDRIKDESIVLEFGPANGRLTRHLQLNKHCVVDIVEYNQVSGKDAAQYARYALIGPSEGDIEKYVWAEKLCNERYDFIIFADVLEHLYDPMEVLKKCGQFLKENGTILFSVPNIANNNVILNLLNDEFEYTPTGILDDTHIRFFSYKSLNRMVKNLGYFASHIDYTTGRIGETEINVSNSKLPCCDMSLIDQHALGNVYQFIYELKFDNEKNHEGWEKYYMKKVITYGTFDLFHEGHYRLLQRAKALGDYLIVGVTTEGYDKTRGKLGVVDSLMTRIENVKKTGFADEIIIEETAGQKFNDIKKYGIDIFTVGSDWTGKFDYLQEFCQVVYLKRTKNISSTMLRAQKLHIQRIGVIGTGRIANRFVPEAKLVSGVNMQGVYNPHGKSTDRFAKKWDIIAYHDLESFFAAVDIVYIASPHETHYEYTMAALQHGKHVLCEKPMALCRADAERAFAYAKERGLILMEAIKTAYCPGFHHLLGIANSGKIGRIKYIDACFTKLENPKHRELVDLEYGGSFLELGSYGMLPVVKLLGADYEDVSFDSIKGENGLDIFTRATFKYANSFASVICGLGVKAEGRLLISGTAGYIVVEAPWWKTSYFEVHYEDPDNVEKYADMFLSYGLRYEISDMLLQMNSGSKGSFKLTRSESAAMADVFERFRCQR